ncbi:hypothetical protein [Ekhidna sp.]
MEIKLKLVIVFVVLFGCSDRGTKSLSACECIVIDYYNLDHRTTLVLKEKEKVCHELERRDFNFNSNNITYHGNDSSLMTIGVEKHILNVRPEILSNFFHASSKFFSDSIEFNSGYKIGFYDADKSVNIVVKDAKTHFLVFDTLLESLEFKNQDTLLIQTLDAVISTHELNERDIPNFFMKYRKMSGLVEEGENYDFMLDLKNSNFPFRMKGYQISELIRPNDSLYKAFKSPEIYLYRKDENDNYQLIASECPKVFSECTD